MSSKQPYQPDYSCIDKNARAAEVMNALLGYARCPAARRNHLAANPAEMSKKGIAIQALVGAVVALAASEGVVVSVENVVRSENPVTGVFDTKVETRWARKIYQYYDKLNDRNYRQKTVDELNKELGRMAHRTGDGVWTGEPWAEVGYIVNGEELTTQEHLAEYVHNCALINGLDLFVFRPIINAAPMKIQLGVQDTSDSQVDEAAGAPLGVLDEAPIPANPCEATPEMLAKQARIDASLKSMLGYAHVMAAIKNGIVIDLSAIPPEALAVMTKIAEKNGELHRRLTQDSVKAPIAMIGDFGSYEEIQSAPLVKVALAEVEANNKRAVIELAVDTYLREEFLNMQSGPEREAMLKKLRAGLIEYYTAASVYDYFATGQEASQISIGLMDASGGAFTAEALQKDQMPLLRSLVETHPLKIGDMTSPIAMGHPYAPYPGRGNVCQSTPNMAQSTRVQLSVDTAAAQRALDAQLGRANVHVGSSFDSFLKEEGLLGSCTEEAKKRIAATGVVPVVMNNDGSLDYYPV